MTGLLTCEAGIRSNAPITVYHDAVTLTDPHLLLRPATAGGTILGVRARNFAGTWGAAFGMDVAGNIGIITPVGNHIDFPEDDTLNEGLWRIDAVGPALEAKRQIMMHSLIFS
jgi:hypothetical protein